MLTPGSVRVEQAYAQGKMLDNSGWYGVLPRSITPSDIDLVFDNAGKQVLAELSSQNERWEEISRGQRLLYENNIIGGGNIALLAKHNVPPDTTINTYRDIVSFHAMLWDGGLITCESIFQGNETWREFIKKWFADPIHLRRRLIGLSVGLVKPILKIVK